MKISDPSCTFVPFSGMKEGRLWISPAVAFLPHLRASIFRAVPLFLRTSADSLSHLERKVPMPVVGSGPQ